MHLSKIADIFQKVTKIDFHIFTVPEINLETTITDICDSLHKTADEYLGSKVTYCFSPISEKKF